MPGAAAPACRMANRRRRLSLAGRVRERFHQRVERAKRVVEAQAPHVAGALELARLERLVDAPRIGHARPERDPDDAVAAHAHHERLRVCGARQQRGDRGMAHHRAEIAIEGAWRPAALHVSEHRDANLAPEPDGKRLADALGGDRDALTVHRPLGHDHHRVAPPGLAPGLERRDQISFPVVAGRALGDEERVGAGGDRPHQREVAAVPAHHLDDEGALVARGRAADGVNRLGDAVERRVGADGHVGAGGVVVDRADQADNRQPRMARGRRRVDLAPGHQFLDMIRPLAAKHVRPGERAVAAHHDQAVDAVPQDGAGGLQAALPRAELLGPRRPDHGPAALDDAAHIRPAERPDLVAALDEAEIALENRAHLESVVQARPDNRPDGRVHAGGVPAAGQNSDLPDRHAVSGAPCQRAIGLTSNVSWMTLANVCAISAKPCWVGCRPSTPMYGFPPGGKAA